jgi:hypothetical protein
VLDTILDLDRQVVGATLEASRELPKGSGFGGLRGGYARLGPSSLVLSRLSFVAGVRLSGTFPIRDGELRTTTLQVSGPAAARGVVRIGTGATVSGTLGGRRFDLAIAKVKLARQGALSWPSHPVAFPLAGLVPGSSARVH